MAPYVIKPACNEQAEINSSRIAKRRTIKISRIKTTVWALMIPYLVVISGGTAHAQSSLPDFGCTSDFYEVIDGQLSLLDIGTGIYTPIGPAQSQYNATGHNINDNYVYGLGQRGAIDGHLIRVGSDGNIDDLGDFGITSPRGAIDRNNRLFYSGNSTRLNFINVATLTTGQVNFTLEAGSPALQNTLDYAYVEVGGDQLIVGARNSSINIWNLSTGMSKRVAVPGLPNDGFGAAWAASNGSLYFSNNGDGTIYEILNATTSPTIGATLSAAQSTAHDGMSCVDAPPPFASAATSPSLTNVKAVPTLTTDADSSGDITAGDTLEYDVTVTNTGDVILTNVVVSDAQLTPNSFTCPTLAIGATCVLTGDHVVTAAEATAGEVVNTASVVSDELTTPISSNTVTTPVEESPAPSLSMTKVATNPGPYTTGDVITYTYTVTNDGDQIIRDIAITDTHNGSDPAPTPGNETLLTDMAPTGDSTDGAVNGSWDLLAPGDVLTFTGTYTVTQTDAENL